MPETAHPTPSVASDNTPPALYVALYLVVSALALWRSMPWWDTVYANTGWWLRYDQGFVKRGLAGQMLQWLGIDATAGVIAAISLALTALFWLLASALLWRLYQRSGYHSGMAWWAIGFAGCSATLQHWLLDQGRLDHLLFAMALLAMGGIWLLRRRPPVLTFVWLLVLAWPTLLIHEAALPMFGPLILAWWLYVAALPAPWQRRATEQHMWLWATACGALMLVMAMVISALGRRDVAHFAQDFAEQQARAGGWLVEVAYAVPYKLGLKESIDLSLFRLGEASTWFYHLEFLLFCLLPLGYLLWHAHARLQANSRFYLTSDGLPAPHWLYLGTLGPLLLYPVAIDFFRWWSWLIVNGYLVLGLVALRDTRLCLALAEAVQAHRLVLWYMLGTSLYLGGLGADTGYPLLNVQTRLGDA